MVKRRIEEEAVVLESEMPVGLPDAALAERDELLAFGESADGDRPFLQSDWHSDIEGGTRLVALDVIRPDALGGTSGRSLKDTEILAKIPNPLQIDGFFCARACTEGIATVQKSRSNQCVAV